MPFRRKRGTVDRPMAGPDPLLFVPILKATTDGPAYTVDFFCPFSLTAVLGSRTAFQPTQWFPPTPNAAGKAHPAAGKVEKLHFPFFLPGCCA